MLDVIAIAAHPDDAEISAGGTLLRLARAGRKIGIVDLTRGEMGTRGTVQTRQEETARANAVLGQPLRINLDLGDGRLVDDIAAREKLAAVLREHAPRLILAHYPEDLHPDHAAAGRLARQAWYLSGLSRLAGSDAVRPAQGRAKRFLSFMGHVTFEPALIVDIGPVWEQKLELVRCYASQLEPDGPADKGEHFLFGADILRRMETRARFFGERAGVRHGEPFASLGPLSVGDPAWFVER